MIFYSIALGAICTGASLATYMKLSSLDGALLIAGIFLLFNGLAQAAWDRKP